MSISTKQRLLVLGMQEKAKLEAQAELEDRALVDKQTGMSLLVFDLEAVTFIGQGPLAILEIGAIWWNMATLAPSTNPKHHFCELVRPASPISADVVGLTGITEALLDAEQPDSIPAVLTRWLVWIQKISRGRPTLAVYHTTNKQNGFDSQALHVELQRSGSILPSNVHLFSTGALMAGLDDRSNASLHLRFNVALPTTLPPLSVARQNKHTGLYDAAKTAGWLAFVVGLHMRRQMLAKDDAPNDGLVRLWLTEQSKQLAIARNTRSVAAYHTTAPPQFPSDLLKLLEERRWGSTGDLVIPGSTWRAPFGVWYGHKLGLSQAQLARVQGESSSGYVDWVSSQLAARKGWAGEHLAGLTAHLRLPASMLVRNVSQGYGEVDSYTALPKAPATLADLVKGTRAAAVSASKSELAYDVEVLSPGTELPEDVSDSGWAVQGARPLGTQLDSKLAEWGACTTVEERAQFIEKTRKAARSSKKSARTGHEVVLDASIELENVLRTSPFIRLIEAKITTLTLAKKGEGRLHSCYWQYPKFDPTGTLCFNTAIYPALMAIIVWVVPGHQVAKKSLKNQHGDFYPTIVGLAGKCCEEVDLDGDIGSMSRASYRDCIAHIRSMAQEDGIRCGAVFMG